MTKREHSVRVRFLGRDDDVPSVIDVLREVRQLLDRAHFDRTEILPVPGGRLDLLLDPVSGWRALRGRSNVLQPSGLAGAYRALLARTEPTAVGMHDLFSGRRFPRNRADRLLSPTLVDRLVASGGLTEIDDDVRSEILLVPHRGDLFVSDGLQLQAAEDFCYLGRMSFPGPDLLRAEHEGDRPGRVRRALDLGCGAGAGAVIASRVADQVVGTDVLPRCVRFGQVNAALNEVANVSFQTADVLDGVAGTFDAVVTHPPGVWSLTAGGAVAEVGGDDFGLELPARMISGALGRLDAGGAVYAILLAPVIHGTAYASTALERICARHPAAVTLYPLVEYYEFGDRLAYQAHHVDRLIRYLAVLRTADRFALRHATLDRARWWSSKLRSAPAKAAGRLLAR